MPPRAPPVATEGVLPWLRRNLFSDWKNTLGTLVVLALLATYVPPLVEWAVFNAVARPDNAACRAVGHAGACWGVIAEKYRLILFGRYPYDEQWRPLVATVVDDRACWRRAATGRSGSAWLIALWIVVLAAFFVLMSGGVFGLDLRRNRALGRLSADDHAVDDRARDRVSAVDRGRARPALAHAGHPHAVRALRRADPRRAADLGAVHGVVHVPAVHAGGHDDRRAAARAGGHHAVLRRLSRRGRARRAAGAAARAGRGRGVARPVVLADDAQGRAAAGAAARRAGDHEHLHRDLQGHVARHHRQPVRPDRRAAARARRLGLAQVLPRGAAVRRRRLFRLLLRDVALQPAGSSGISNTGTRRN